MKNFLVTLLIIMGFSTSLFSQQNFHHEKGYKYGSISMFKNGELIYYDSDNVRWDGRWAEKSSKISNGGDFQYKIKIVITSTSGKKLTLEGYIRNFDIVKWEKNPAYPGKTRNYIYFKSLGTFHTQ